MEQGSVNRHWQMGRRGCVPVGAGIAAVFFVGLARAEFQNSDGANGDAIGLAAYVSNPPFQERALKSPGIAKITDSFEAFGGPSTFSVVYAKESFATSNPKIVAAFYAALQDALTSIGNDHRGAIDKYLAVTKERTERALLEDILNRPDFTFGSEPTGTLPIAELMHRVGLLKNKPASWKDFFAPLLHGAQGS
jgi:NitT/TauT family transport system substrate-binding protein